MNLTCNVKVVILADYHLVEPKELKQALKDYTHYGSSEYFSMGKDNLLLECRWAGYLTFNNMADMVANIEKQVINKLHYDLGINWVENWEVRYTVLSMRGSIE